ncbi:MAG: hypothetical protein ACXVPY_14385 [Bacteroidia bacterium]
MKLAFSIIFILFYSLSFGQGLTETHDSLRKDFMSDPDGDRGLREKHTYINMNPGGRDEVFFDGLCIIGKTKKELIGLLGPPNSIEYRADYVYYISMCSYIIPKHGKQWSGIAFVIHTRFNIVTSVTIRVYCG